MYRYFALFGQTGSEDPRASSAHFGASYSAHQLVGSATSGQLGTVRQGFRLARSPLKPLTVTSFFAAGLIPALLNRGAYLGGLSGYVTPFTYPRRGSSFVR